MGMLANNWFPTPNNPADAYSFYNQSLNIWWADMRNVLVQVLQRMEIPYKE
jgi:hypothetical protein